MIIPEKSASFSCLRDTVYWLKDAHSVADIISIISNVIPLDTGLACQESQLTSKAITDKVLCIENLNLLHLLPLVQKW